MKKNNSNSINLVLVVFQFLLTIACIVLVILYFAVGGIMLVGAILKMVGVQI